MRAVVDDLRRRLESEVRQAFTGRLSQHRHSPLVNTGPRPLPIASTTT